MNHFDQMTARFTEACHNATHWKDYPGAAYATRIKLAIADLKAEIIRAESNPEIGFVTPSASAKPHD